jgi:hypothetical protein
MVPKIWCTVSAAQATQTCEISCMRLLTGGDNLSPYHDFKRRAIFWITEGAYQDINWGCWKRIS